MTIRETMLRHTPKNILNAYRWLKYDDYRSTMDHKVCFGNQNKDKTFYVFRYDKSDWGIHTIVLESMLDKLEEIVNKGYIPVFDFQNYRPKMLEDEKSLNLWYRYFEKYSDYTDLGEVYKSRNVILGKINGSGEHVRTYTKDGVVHLSITSKIKLFNKYMKPAKEVTELANNVWKNNVFDTDKVMGVAVRECYRYFELKGKEFCNNHPRSLNIKEQLNLNDEKMEKWGCNKIFLMTDDRECLEKYKQHYKDNLLYLERPLPHFFIDDEIVLDINERMKEIKEVSLGDNIIKYLVEIELLSKCDCAISSISNGFIAAILRNCERYEHLELLDLGLTGD